MQLDKLEVDELRFFLGGQADVAMRLHELLTTSLAGVLVGATGRADSRRFIGPEQVEAVGYEDDEAMLPVQHRALSGLRVLQEYFAFPARFLFFDIEGLRPLLAGLRIGARAAIAFLEARRTARWCRQAANFSLHCVPAINLFSKRVDRIEIDDSRHEFHVVPDRTAPLDYEVFDVFRRLDYDAQGTERRSFRCIAPDYGRSPHLAGLLQRLARTAADVGKGAARRPPIGVCRLGGISVAGRHRRGACSHSLRQLSVQTRCTNRDLPLFLIGGREGPLHAGSGHPAQWGACDRRPSRPYTALREGGVAWRFSTCCR